MSVQPYQTASSLPSPALPMARPPSRPDAEHLLSDRHRQMLEVESGIDPARIPGRYRTITDRADLIAEGYADYQARNVPGVLISEYTTAGVQRGSKYRPDRPRTDRTNGKPIKYESPAGSQLQIDCPPGITPLLRDPSVPLYITEGSKKADAAVSRGIACISVSGVWAFRRGRVVLPDFDDIALDGREVRPAFDDDVMTKPEVRAALDALNHALWRRGAKVRPVLLCDPRNPETPAGSAKIGLDDFLVRAGDAAGVLLDQLATDWTPPAASIAREEPADPDIEYWKARALAAEAEIVQLRRTTSAQAQLLRNPHLKDTPRKVGFATITEANAKKARGEVEPDGRVRLQISEIVNDYRPKPPKGKAMPETNPQDGSFPLTRRDTAKATIKQLAEGGALDVVFLPTIREAADGSKYTDSDVLVKIDDAPAAILHLANYAERRTRKPYTRQEPCPHCGEAHPRRVLTTAKTYCEGCGSQTGEEETTIRIIPLPVANDPDASLEERNALERWVSANSASQKNGEGNIPPSSPSILSVSQKRWEAPLADPAPLFASQINQEVEPDGLWDMMSADPDIANHCLDCGSPTSNTYRCTPCIEVAQRHEAERWRHRA